MATARDGRSPVAAVQEGRHAPTMRRMQILSFVLSGAGLLGGSLALLLWLFVNAPLALVNWFAYKPTPYLYASYGPVFIACALAEALFMARLHWGSVLLPAVPLLWAWHLGLIGR